MELEFYKEDELESDKYLRKVLNYIKNRHGRNENQIKNDLAEDGTCSELTARRKIKRLLYLGLIEDRKEKKNGFHRFYPVDRTEFKRFDQILDRIGLLINRLDQPLLKEIVEGSDEYPWTHVYALTLEFFSSMNDIILFLLSLANNGRLSKYDSAILTRKIIEFSLHIGLMQHDPTRIMTQVDLISDRIKYHENIIAEKKILVEGLQNQEGKTKHENESTLRHLKELELTIKQMNEMKHIFDDFKSIVEILSVKNEK